MILAPENVYIRGYWQNEKYFKDIGPIIRKEFTFKYRLDKTALSLVRKIEATNSVSLHFRRTDYVGKEVEKVCQHSYYYKALAIISHKISNPHLFIFSDDIQWVKENFFTGFPATYVDDTYTSGEGWKDMLLMSKCKHNIIANSSFSWWGAWLNPNHEKIIVTPGEWNFKKNINSIVPEKWNKVV